MKTLLLDAFNIGHIALHSMGELDYQGRKTGVTYGVMLRILQLAKKYDTNNFVFCWDSKRSLRKTIFPEYKKKRNEVVRTVTESNDYAALQEQLEEMRTTILPRLGFSNVLRYPGLEGDDVMALVVINGVLPTQWNKDFVIVSTDKDMYQMLSSNVIIHNIRSGKKYTENDFAKEYGITPYQWCMAKAIGGCSGDGVPGLLGIGDPAQSAASRAIKYLKGTLKGKYLANIQSPAGQAIIQRNLQLVWIPIRGHIKPIIKQDVFCIDNFIDVFDELGFTSFLKNDKIEEWKTWLKMN